MDGYFFIRIVTISFVTVTEFTIPCSISLSRNIMYSLLINITSFVEVLTVLEGAPSLLVLNFITLNMQSQTYVRTV